MSHQSVSHRGLKCLTSSPLRRKSMLNLSSSDINIRQNDDDAERMERRRNAEMEMRQGDVTPPASEKRKSIGASISGLSAAQLAEHYANCIKLSTENKINTKNAFSLQLIDYMAMMLKKHDSKMDNFQVASCTLDASTKIYAYRVDCVHTDVLKMAGGLAAGSRKKHNDDGEEEGHDGNVDGEDGEIVRTKKKTRRRKNTVAVNVETLNGKLDLQHVTDPFFLRSSGNLSDCQPGDCHFLTNLKIRNNCALMLCSELLYWHMGEEIINIEQKVQLPLLPDLTEKGICPVFSQFSFTSWSLDAEEETTDPMQNEPALPPENDFIFDVNAVPEPVPDDENEEPVDHFEVSGVDEAFDSDGGDAGTQPVACRPTHRPSAANIVDLRKHLSSAPSEYSYFRAGALDLWAGPSHWKIRPFKGSDRYGSSGAPAERAEDGSEVARACKRQKQKQKKELVIEYSRELNNSVLSIEKKIQILKLTKRTMHKVWSAEKNTLPYDIHYEIKRFSQLELRKTVGVSVHPAPYEYDQSSGYDYENDHDASEYCPNVALNDDLDDADDGPIDGLLPSQQQDVHNSFAMEGAGQMETFSGDNLVAPPNKVARIFIPYAMRAKKVDMKKLKNAMWDILTDADNHKDKPNAEDLRIERPVTFRNMYTILPSRLSSKLAENLSAPLAIVALLHLANEKTLHIEGNEELSDLTITQA